MKIRLFAKMKTKKYRNIIGLLIIIAISIPIILPYFHSGYFPTHDGEWAVVRLADMFRELRDHQFPPRYSGTLNFGYGYPLFNFAYPFPYYLGIIFYFLKFGFTNSIKIIFALSVILSAVSMYLLSKKMWNNSVSGVVSAVLYVYLPYRMVDLYVRGSIGESVSFVLFPLIFYGVFQIYQNPKSRFWMPFSAIMYALLILSHNIMAVLFSILIVMLMATLSYLNRKIIIQCVLVLVCGFLLASFFAIPALVEKNDILLAKIPIADRSLYFVSVQQLVIPSWGYGVPTDQNGGFSYQLGIPQVIIFIMTICYCFISFVLQKKKKDNSLLIASAFSVLSLVLIALLFSPTLFIWQHVPLLKEINYPWTLLAPLGFLASLFSGFLASRTKVLSVVIIVLGILAILFTISYAHPQYFVDHGDPYYMTNEATTTSSDEYTPLWVKQKPIQHFSNKVEVVKGNATIQNVFYNSHITSFTVSARTQSTIKINTIYYPGWQAFVNNHSVPIDYHNIQGVMEISVSSGANSILLKFSETPLRLVADGLSIIAAILLIAYILLKNKFSYIKKYA